MDNKSFDMNSLVGTFLEVSYENTGMLFKCDRSKAQDYYMTPGTKWVCEYHIRHSYFDIQVVFPLLESYDYNMYLIHIYAWKRKKLYIIGFNSGTKYPPVWDRSFSVGADYIDYVFSQHQINQFLKKQGLPLIDVDYTLDGKAINLTNQTIEEIENLITNGESYNIMSVKAETQPHLKEQCLKHFSSPTNM